MSDFAINATIILGGTMKREELNEIEKVIREATEYGVSEETPRFNEIYLKNKEYLESYLVLEMTLQLESTEFTDIETFFTHNKHNKYDVKIYITNSEEYLQSTVLRCKENRVEEFYYDESKTFVSSEGIEQAFKSGTLEELLERMKFCESDVEPIKILDSAREIIAEKINNLNIP